MKGMYSTVYLVHSIYHILYATSLAVQKAKKVTGLKQLCIIASSSYTLNDDLVQQLITGFSDIIEYSEIPGMAGAEDLSRTGLQVVESFKRAHINELVIFNQDNLLAVHLAQHFASRSAIVALAQDGVKAYSVIDKAALRYRILRSLDYYRYCRKYGFNYHFLFISMKYGRFNALSLYYLTHSEANQRKGISVRRVGLKLGVLDYLASSVQADFDYIKPTVFFSSSLMGKRQLELDFERKLLEDIANVMPGWQLVLKLHPRAKHAVREAYESISGWQVLQDQIPAELYLCRMKFCVSLSSYSGTALYSAHGTSSHLRIWLFPLYNNVLPALKYLRINCPDPEIRIVKDHPTLVAVLSDFYKSYHASR